MGTPPGPAGGGFLEAIISAMTDDGGLPADPEAVGEMMERFNSLPFEERGRILGLEAEPLDPWERLTSGLALSPAPAPPPDLDGTAAATPILGTFELLRRFVGTGRKLTTKGNLTRADARALATELGDPAMALLTELGSDIRSADELALTQMMLGWARAAGALRVEHQRMIATQSWARLDPVRQAERAVVGLLKKGPLQLFYGDWRWAPNALYQVLDEGVPHLLAVVWALPQPAEFDLLLEGAFEVCEQMLAWGPASTADFRLDMCRHGLDRVFEHLERAGVTRRVGATTVKTPGGHDELRGGTVEITALGRAVLAGYLGERGYPVPEVGEMADRPLADLLAHLGDWHVERVQAEFDRWVDCHSPGEAAAGLAGVLSAGYPDAEWPMAVLSLAERLPDPHRESTARAMLATPARGHAISWLTGHQAADVPDDPAAMMTAGIEMLAFTAAAFGDDRFQQSVAPLEDPLGFVADCAATGTPAAVEVLRAMARTSADPAVAAAARKAAMRVASPAPSRSHSKRDHRAVSRRGRRRR